LVSDATPGPGAIVRAQRELRGLTRQDIADTLNLGARVVEDMEAENWARLPAAAFTRGYLRAYAKLLDIDPDAVTRAFDAAMSRDATPSADVVTSMRRAHGRGVEDLMQKHPGVVLTAAVAGVICAVLIVLWAVWPEVNEPAAVRRPAAPSAVVTSKTAPTPEPAAATGAEAPPAETAQIAGGAPMAASAATVTPRSAPHDDHGARRITSDGDDRLKFGFTDDCWVEIKDAQGASLYSDLGKSGDTLELVGRRPFHILLGNAPAATLMFNGERVALSPHTRNNVGTLVLGQ
jgi:cytoskeleton protein RodZ